MLRHLYFYSSIFYKVKDCITIMQIRIIFSKSPSWYHLPDSKFSCVLHHIQCCTGTWPKLEEKPWIRGYLNIKFYCLLWTNTIYRGIQCCNSHIHYRPITIYYPWMSYIVNSGFFNCKVGRKLKSFNTISSQKNATDFVMILLHLKIPYAPDLWIY